MKPSYLEGTMPRTLPERQLELARYRRRNFQTACTTEPEACRYAFGGGVGLPAEDVRWKRDMLLKMEGLIEPAELNYERSHALERLSDTELPLKCADGTAALEHVLKGISRYVEIDNNGGAAPVTGKKEIREAKRRAGQFNGELFPTDFGYLFRYVGVGNYSHDTVYLMLTAIVHGKDGLGDLGVEGSADARREAESLMDRIRQRKMKQETYASLLEGTHPLVQKSK